MLTTLASRRGASIGKTQISADVSALTFNAVAAGGDPTPQKIIIRNSGRGAFGAITINSPSYLGAQSGWLPLATYNAVTHEVTVSPVVGSIPAGTHQAIFGITDSHGSLLVVSVDFVVAPSVVAPHMVLSSTSESFASSVGTNPTPKSVHVLNSGSGNLGAVVPTVTYGGGEPTGWLGSPSVNSTNLNDQIVTLTPLVGVLTAQTLNYTVSLASAGTDNSPRTITGSFVISNPGAFPALNVGLVQNEFGVALTRSTATDQITGDMFDTSYVLPTGTVRFVADQGNAIANKAEFNRIQGLTSRGDIIVWQDGISFEGTITIKDYGPGTAWVYYMPASEYNRATGTTTYGTNVFPVAPPTQGNRNHWSTRRVPWSAQSMLSKFYSGVKSQLEQDAAIRTTPSSGCSYVRLIGMNVTTNPAWTNATDYNYIGFMMILGLYGKPNAAVDAAHMPHHIILDRCLVKNQAGHHVKRGLSVVTEKTAVIGSRVWSDYTFKATGATPGDGQAFTADECPGWLLLEGNEFKGGQESCFLGGYTTPTLAPKAPTHDVIVRGNWIHQETDGVHTYLTKNCIETKGTVRLLMECNVISHLKGDSQYNSIVCKVDRTAEGGNTSTDNLIRYNYIHDVCGGFLFGGLEGSTGTAIAPVGIEAYNNLFRRMNIAPYNTAGTQYAHQFTDRAHAWIHHNTTIDVGPLTGYASVGGTPYADQITIRDNIGPFGNYGYSAPGVLAYTGGINSLQYAYTNVTWSNEIFFGVTGSEVNPDHTFKRTAFSGRGHLGYTTQAGLQLDASGNGHLDPASPLNTASSTGGPVGVMNWTPFDSDLYAVES